MSNATLWACRTGPRTTIHQLPDEVILEAIEWLPRKDYGALCLVSKRMYGITRPSLTKVFRVGRLAEALLPEGRLSILAQSDLAKHCKELIIHPTHNAGYIMNLMAIETSALLSLLTVSLPNLQTLRVRDVYLPLSLLRALVVDHPNLTTLEYDELATALAVSWRKIQPLEREIGIPPLLPATEAGSATQKTVHVPNLLVGSNPSRRNLNSARYPSLARSSLLESGRFTFHSITFLDLPSLFPLAHPWSPIPGLRKITLHELPLPASPTPLAEWFTSLIGAQPLLQTIELVMSQETHDGDLSEACGPEQMEALAGVPWFADWGAVVDGAGGLMKESWVRRLRVKAERRVGVQGQEGEGEVTGVGISFLNVNGIPQFLQRVRVGCKGLKELEIGVGLEYCSWNDTLRALSFPPSHHPLRSLTLTSFLLPHSTNGSLIPSCTPQCHARLTAYSPHLSSSLSLLGGSHAVWKHTILESNLDRVRSLGRVLPHGCELSWSPQGGVDLGTWRGRVFRASDGGKAGGRGMVRDSPGRPSSVSIPTTSDAFAGVGTCWSCLEWQGETVNLEKKRGGLSTPGVEWDLSRAGGGEDWDVGSRKECVGKFGGSEGDWLIEG